MFVENYTGYCYRYGDPVCPLCKENRRISEKKNGSLVCEKCGAICEGPWKVMWKHDSSWTKTCKKCGCHPERLVGLFIPHLCGNCERGETEANRKAGNVCRMCHQTYNRCCC